MAKDETKYLVNWDLHGHRGKNYAAGDSVSMSDEDAAPLLACGVLTVFGEQSADLKPESDAGADGAGDGEGEQSGEPAGQ